MNENTAQPTRAHVRRIAVDVTVVRDAFRLQWMTAGRPRMEDYLTDVSEPERTELLRLLLGVDSEFRIRHGDTAQG